MSAVVETACSFGAEGHLAGILTGAPCVRRAIACVLINAGLVPKFGRYRLYPEIARRLAPDGVPTLRFDLSGMGDSRQHGAGLPLHERMTRDIRAAVDHTLAVTGATGVVLVGLCSGGEDGLRYADGDPRVRGVVMIDPFAYRTPGWRWRNVAFRVARRTLRTVGMYQPFVNPAADAALVEYVYLAPDQAERILAGLIARRAPSHFIYTGGKAASFNYEGQLADMFPRLDFGGQVTVDLFAETEHTQVMAADRQRMVDIVAGRILAAHPPV